MSRKSIVSICSAIVLVLLVGQGCTPKRGGGQEEQPGPEVSSDSLRFDPLELAEDREVIPAKYPVAADVKGGETFISGGSGALLVPDTLERASIVADDEATSLDGQVFRVQLFSTKLFGEARQARRVAEEIFDRPVYMDYEVPYFKVRVGSFPDRFAAENYAQRARTAGYADAWVVATAVAVRTAAPLYDEGSELPPLADSTAADTSGAGEPDDNE